MSRAPRARDVTPEAPPCQPEGAGLDFLSRGFNISWATRRKAEGGPMHRRLTTISLAMAWIATGCSGSAAVDGAKGGAARVALGSATYEVRDDVMTIETGEDTRFRIVDETGCGVDATGVAGM